MLCKLLSLGFSRGDLWWLIESFHSSELNFLRCKRQAAENGSGLWADRSSSREPGGRAGRACASDGGGRAAELLRHGMPIQYKTENSYWNQKKKKEGERRRKGAPCLESPTRFWHDLSGNFPTSTSNLFFVCFQTWHISLISEGKQVRNRKKKKKQQKSENSGRGNDVITPHWIRGTELGWQAPVGVTGAGGLPRVWTTQVPATQRHLNGEWTAFVFQIRLCCRFLKVLVTGVLPALGLCRRLLGKIN